MGTVSQIVSRGCRSREALFLAGIALSVLLLAGWREALICLALLALFSRLGGSFIPQPETLSPAPDETFRIFFSSLLGIGFFSLLWTGAGLFVDGAFRLLLAAAVGATVVWVGRRRRGAASHRPSAGPAVGVILVALLVTLLCLYPPMRNLGRPTDQGTAYRAYFSTDYLKGFSVTAALNRNRLPPGNPYFRGERLHYYWLSFAFPAAISGLTGDVHHAMTAFSAVVAFLLLGVILLWLQAAAPPGKRRLCFFLALVPVFFLSLEGLYLILARPAASGGGALLDAVRRTNVDGLTRWLFPAPQVDSLLRTLLFMPQAGLSLAYFGLYLHLRDRAAAAFYLNPLLLLLSLGANFLVGLGFLAVLGLDLLYRCLDAKRRVSWPFFLRQAGGAAAAVLLSLLIFYFLGILASGRGVYLSWIGWKSLIPFLGLNLGLLLPAGLAGALPGWRRRSDFAAALLLTAIICTVRIRGFESDIALKLGLVLQLVLLAGLLPLFLRLAAVRRILPSLLTLLFLPALPTAVFDIYNSSDVRNRAFTFHLPEDERLLLAWAGRNLPASAVIQDFPPARTWGVSVIPAFSGRGTWVGDEMHSRIFLIDDRAYRNRIDQLRRCFADLAAHRARLHAAGIDYVLWGDSERREFGYTPRLPAAARIGGATLFSLR